MEGDYSTRATGDCVHGSPRGIRSPWVLTAGFPSISPSTGSEQVWLVFCLRSLCVLGTISLHNCCSHVIIRKSDITLPEFSQRNTSRHITLQKNCSIKISPRERFYYHPYPKPRSSNFYFEECSISLANQRPRGYKSGKFTTVPNKRPLLTRDARSFLFAVVAHDLKYFDVKAQQVVSACPR